MNSVDDTKKLEIANRGRHKLKRDHELTNPCLKETRLSVKCLDDNNYDRKACKLYFDNYINCQKFWTEIRRERSGKGIMPALPPPDERAKIKAEYMMSKNKQ